METRPKASFFSIGCKLNQYETEGLKECFRSEGFEVIPFGQKADVVVVNTCTVTTKGDRSSRQALRRAVKNSPGAIVAAVGCYAQISPQQLASIPGIDLVVGTSKREHLVELLRQRQQNPGDRPLVCRGKFSGFQSFDIRGFDRHTRAFVKVQEGCDNHCAYCIVPYARGPSRSRPLGDTLQQINRLVNRGYQEIVLTGICLGSYGLDLLSDGQRINLRELVKRLEELKGLARYRLSSIEPSYISEELVNLLYSSPKFCRHLHIPLQSGDTEVLEKMGRPYSAEEYRDLLWMLKTQMPDLAIGADVIVGFPGETHDHFQNTYRLIQNLPLSYLHVFRFSPRKGTAAYQMEDRVDDYTKKLRSQKLRELDREKRRAFISSFLGRSLPVLFETSRDKQTGLLTGLTGNYIRVLAESSDELMNRIVKVRLERIQGEKVSGKVEHLGTVEAAPLMA